MNLTYQNVGDNVNMIVHMIFSDLDEDDIAALEKVFKERGRKLRGETSEPIARGSARPRRTREAG